MELALPGEFPRAESEMAKLVGRFDRELLQIAATAESGAELQLAAWLGNLASLPSGSARRSEYAWIRCALNQVPRPRGSCVLEQSVSLSPGDLEAIGK